jgi:hypothetical protein
LAVTVVTSSAPPSRMDRTRLRHSRPGIGVVSPRSAERGQPHPASMRSGKPIACWVAADQRTDDAVTGRNVAGWIDVSAAAMADG